MSLESHSCNGSLPYDESQAGRDVLCSSCDSVPGMQAVADMPAESQREHEGAFRKVTDAASQDGDTPESRWARGMSETVFYAGLLAIIATSVVFLVTATGTLETVFGVFLGVGLILLVVFWFVVAVVMRLLAQVAEDVRLLRIQSAGRARENASGPDSGPRLQ
jgi:hypothetical protein